MKYKQAFQELNKILKDLQSEDIDVDELTDKVKRALELIKICKEKIEKTELEVKKIIEEFQRSSLEKEV